MSLLQEDSEYSLDPLMATDSSDNDKPKSFMHYFSVVMSNALLFFLVFGLSATVDVKSLKKSLRNKFAIGTGVAMQFLIMPVLGFLAVVLLRNQGLTSAMGITLLVVTSSPGGSYSNWWCSTFNGDLALSVTMTSISSLISVAMLPANLFLYSYLAFNVFATEEDTQTTSKTTETQAIVQSLDFKSIFVTLGVVMGAILVGLLAGYKWDYPAFHVACNRMGTVSGLGLVLFSIFLSFSGNNKDGEDHDQQEESQSLFSYSWAFYLAVAFPCLLGIILANVLSRTFFRLSPPECVTLSIECCYQNVGIATSVAVTMFADSPTERAQAIAVPLFYGVVEAVAIGVYCVWAWKAGWTKAPPHEKFCVVVSKTYEVDDPQEEENDDDPKNQSNILNIPENPSESNTEFGKRSNQDSSSCTKIGNRKRLVSEDTAVTCSTMGSSATPEKSHDSAFGMVALDEEYGLSGEDSDSQQRFMEDTA